jgi:hypothetical protein
MDTSFLHSAPLLSHFWGDYTKCAAISKAQIQENGCVYAVSHAHENQNNKIVFGLAFCYGGMIS